MPSPTAEAVAEFNRRRRELSAAQESGSDTTEIETGLARFMRSNGFGEELPPDDPAADADADVLSAAVLQATTEGDTATVEKLKALASRPAELKSVLAQFQK